LRGLTIHVHAYLAEIATKARLEKGASGRLQWLPGRAQDLTDDRGCDGRASWAGRLVLPRQPLGPARRALPIGPRGPPARAAPLRAGPSAASCPLARSPPPLLLVPTLGCGDGELPLQPPAAKQPQHGLVPDGPLQPQYRVRSRKKTLPPPFHRGSLSTRLDD